MAVSPTTPMFQSVLLWQSHQTTAPFLPTGQASAPTPLAGSAPAEQPPAPEKTEEQHGNP